MEALESRQLLAVSPPVISEFLAINDNTLTDTDGDYSDWIEIYNPNPTSLEMGGWYLTDDAAELTKWQFPEISIGAGNYLLVFASGKDRRLAGAELHTNFKLDGEGEYLGLIRPDGATVVQEFAPQYPPQHSDVSFGMDEELLGSKYVSVGAAARVYVPRSDALGQRWTGRLVDEPFNDSSAAGWIEATTGIGYDTVPGAATQKEVIGNPLVSRPSLDSALGGIYLLESFPFTRTGELASWSVFGSGVRTITPLVCQVDELGEYVITGIGRSRTTSGGEQQFAFELQDGSAQVGMGYFFGWKDGSTAADNAGVVPFTGNTAQGVRAFGQHTVLSAGDNLGTGSALLRTYSVQASSMVADSRPQAYWTFDDNALDASGNGHHGTITGAAYSSQVPAALGAGKSLSFDGQNDYVSALLDVSETSYTSSLWFRADTASRGLFSVVDGDLGSGGHDRHVYLSGGNLATRVWNDQTIATAGKNYADGNWHHVAHVVGAAVGGQRIYVDGQLVASGSKASSDFNWQKRVNIGFSNDSANPYFDGLIDDVAVWDSVLTEAQIQALAQGASPMALAGYASLVATDVRAAVQGVNTSAYLRIPFEATPSLDFDTLRLRMKYDDGFVAWLNGVEVARRNAPSATDYRSAASSDRSKGQAIAFEDIDLTAYMNVLRAGRNILAIQGLNDRVDSPDFLIVPELVKAQRHSDRYLTTPTPGQPNASGVIDFVADTQFSVQRGLFTTAFAVTITTATPGAEIWYTTDGSIPTPSNPRATAYTAPVPIGTTTTLRAAAYKSGYEPTNVDTQTYIFTAAVAHQPANPPGLPATWSGGTPADYEVDPNVVNTALPGYRLEDALRSIPTISLTTDMKNLFGAADGIYYNSEQRGAAWERPASIELINPDGSPGFQIDAGVRMHGNSSRVHWFTPKHPLRISFKAEYGATKLEYPLFPDSSVTEFDQLLLRGCSTDSWPVVDGDYVMGVQRWNRLKAQYLRDQWMRDAQLAMGQPSAHGIYVHLYLNGLYWGLYNLTERPNASFNAEYLGGSKDEYDVIKDFSELEAGTRDAWNEMIALAAAGLDSDAAYQRIQGNHADGTRNPNYPVYLDVDNLIDYMILHIYAGAEDWPDHNWWAARRRGPESEGFRFFSWDQEISNDSLVRVYTRISTRFEDPISSPSPSYLYGQLKANATFRQKFIDRVHELLFAGGLLTPAANQARWMARTAEIDHAIVGESARWGDSKREPPYKREVEWLNEQNWMRNSYWAQIHAIALQRFKRVGLYPNTVAPSFNQQGGDVAPGFLLTMTAPGGVIYYTLDGSDPKLADGTIHGTVYGGPIAITESAVVKARVLQGGEWSALGQAEFLVGGIPITSSLVITELSYAPYPPTLAEQSQGFVVADDFEFVELKNVGGQKLDLTNMQFTGGIQYAFTSQRAGSPIHITEAGTTTPDYVEIQSTSATAVDTSGWVVAVNNATANQINDVHSVLWALPASMSPGQVLYRTDSASNNYWGEDIAWRTLGKGWVMIVDKAGKIADFVVWGYSPAEIGALRVTINGFELTLGDAWQGSAVSTPGSADQAFSLQRRGSADHHDASDWAFVGPQSLGTRNAGLSVPFTVDPITIDAGAYLVVARNAAALRARYGEGMDIAGEFSGSLSNDGEQITLLSRFGRTLLDFTYGDSGRWPGRADGKGATLELIDPTSVPVADAARKSYLEDGNRWRSSSEYGGSPGYAGIGPVGSVVVNEVLSHSDAPLLDTIELFNPTSREVNVGGWYLSDSSANYRKFRILPGTTIAAGGYLVFDEHDFNPDPLDGGLNGFALDGAHGDDVWLMQADTTGKLTYFIDHVEFGAARSGESLGRWPNGAGDLYPMAATTFDPAHGANRGPRVGPLVFSEVQYKPKGSSPDDREFVEINNPTSEAVDLTNWHLAGGIGFDFPAGATLAAHAAMIVVPFAPGDAVKSAAFRSFYGVGLSVQMFGPYSGKLSDNGEKIQLQRPDRSPADEPNYVPRLLEDEVEYAATWYPSTGNGDSLNRLGSQRWGNDVTSWGPALPSPGTASFVAEVVARHIFYNGSALDGGDTAANAKDDAAIAPDKQALLPGQSASFVNYTSYSRGINGLMIDIADLPMATSLTATDFLFCTGNDNSPSGWRAVSALPSVTVRRGAGEYGSDRVTLVWPDGAIARQWLQVTVLANARTGLAKNDVFYFGNAIGETGNSSTDARVEALDLLLTRNQPRSFLDPAPLDFAYDFNRDGRVNAIDMLIARHNQTNFASALALFTAPSSKSGGLQSKAMKPKAARLAHELVYGEPRFLAVR